MKEKIETMLAALEDLLDVVLFSDTFAYTTCHIDCRRDITKFKLYGSYDLTGYMKILLVLQKIVLDLGKASSVVTEYKEYKLCKKILNDEVGI